MGESHKRQIHRLAAPRGTHAAPRTARGRVTLIVAMRARPGRESDLEKELKSLVACSRSERGCLAYDLHASSDVPGLFLLREVWTSMRHHQKHWETVHMKKWSEKKAALVETREASFWRQIA